MNMILTEFNETNKIMELDKTCSRVEVTARHANFSIDDIQRYVYENELSVVHLTWSQSIVHDSKLVLWFSHIDDAVMFKLRWC